MIFVTVGTHEQPFNRLVKWMDDLKKNGTIEEEIIIQIGYSTYKPKYCSWKKLFPYQEMIKLVSDARIVITHGGPSSFIMPLQIKKIPIVVPRRRKFNEHVNDHQVDFVNRVANIQKNIIVVNEIDELKKIIQNYDEIVDSMLPEVKSNNAIFNQELEHIVNSMFN